MDVAKEQTDEFCQINFLFPVTSIVLKEMDQKAIDDIERRQKTLDKKNVKRNRMYSKQGQWYFWKDSKKKGFNKSMLKVALISRIGLKKHL